MVSNTAIRRTNQIDVELVNQGIKYQNQLGTAAAAIYLQFSKIPFGVAYRVLLHPAYRRTQ